MSKKSDHLSPPQVRKEIAQLSKIADLLDSAVQVPGTNFKVGLDALIGLVPGFGDAIGALLSSYIVMKAARLGLPITILVRMVGNVLIDAIVGFVPILGDLFDIIWGANKKNIILLEAALNEDKLVPRSTSKSGRLLGIIALSFLFLILFLIAFAAVLFFRGIAEIL